MNLTTEFEIALTHHRAGRLAEAEGIYRNLLTINAKHAGALLHLGLIAHQSGQNQAALKLIDSAIKADPKYAEAHYNHGTILHAEGKLEKAAESFRKAARTDKKHVGALYSLAGVQHLLGETEKAIKNYKNALKLAPNQPEIYTNLALVLSQNQQLKEALKNANKALNLNPHAGDAHFVRGDILAELGRTQKALDCYDVLLAEDPNNTNVLTNKAAAMQESKAPADALPIYDQLLKLLPGQSEPFSNKANALLKIAAFDEALDHYTQAIKINPGDSQSIYNQALCLLSLGRFEEALPGFENRLKNEDNVAGWQDDKLSFWQKGEELSGPLYLRSEQGVGDHLLWSTQIPLLLERGLEIVFECDPRLKSLLSRSFPDIKVIAEGATLPTVEDQERQIGQKMGQQIGMASVPYLLGDWHQTFKPKKRVFEPDFETVAKFRKELAEIAAGRPVIGISWRSARRKVGLQKSLPLDQWRAILENRDALFVNLQYGDTNAEIAAAMADFKADIFTFPKLDRMNDLDDFSALIDALDLVITTSNVTAHFSGGLGKPSWLALQKVPLWYWGHQGSADRFYPSTQAYRQIELNEWSNVVAEIAEDLTQFLG